MKKFISGVLCLVAICCLLCSVVPSIKAKALQGVSVKDIINASNTYNLEINDEGKAVIGTREDSRRSHSTQYFLSYDLTKKNERRVSDKTSVTIFTPGYGMGAETWSNQLESGRLFGYDSRSILSKIAEKVENPLVLWGKATGYNECFFYDITNDTSMRFDTKSKVSISITPDLVQCHIILVYDPDFECQDDSNANAYYRFNYAVSSLLYQIQSVNGGWIPKVNLVGHSRGGLVNLLYAMDHPDLVSNMISIGTPYQGSTSATVAQAWEGYKGDGLDDIVDHDLYLGYRNRWNNNYEKLYSGINVLAIGGYFTIDFLSDIAHNDESEMNLTNWATAVDIGLSVVISAHLAYPKESSAGIKSGIKSLSRLLNTICPEVEATAWAEILANEIRGDVYFPFLSWYSDMLVPLESQLGIGRSGSFKGFQSKIKCFKKGDNTDFTRVASNAPPVVHNLEPYDKTIIGWSIDGLNLDSGVMEAFSYEKNTDKKLGEGIVITGVAEGYASYDQVLYIPSVIDGKKVIAIGDYAFAADRTSKIGDEDDKNLVESDKFYAKGLNGLNINKVVIPSTVKEIGENAFEGNYGIKNVEFENNSLLEKIGAGAFQNCTHLESFLVPSGVVEIGGNAFSGCESIKKFLLPTELQIIGEKAFSYMNMLTDFEWESGIGSYFRITDGILFTKDYKELIQCPALNETKQFRAPDETRVIRDYAMFECMNLKSVQFYTIEYLGNSAFVGSRNLETINISELIEGSWSAFSATLWYNNRNDKDYVLLGKNLLKYSGKQTIFTEEDYSSEISRIGGNAFDESSVEKLIIPSSINTITEEIVGDSKITDIYFDKLSKLMGLCLANLDDEKLAGMTKNCNISVCFSDYETVKNYEAFSAISDRVMIRKTVVSDSDSGKKMTVYFGENYDLSSILANSELFLKDENNVTIAISGIWDRIETDMNVFEEEGSDTWVSVGEEVLKGFPIVKNDRFSLVGNGMDYVLTVNDISYNVFLPVKDRRYFKGWLFSNAALVLGQTYVYTGDQTGLTAQYGDVWYIVSCYDKHYNGGAGNTIGLSGDFKMIEGSVASLYDGIVQSKTYEEQTVHVYVKGICKLGESICIDMDDFMNAIPQTENRRTCNVNFEYLYVDMPCLSYIDSKHNNKVLIKRYFLPGTDKRETYWLAPNDKKPAEDTYYDVYGIYDLSTVQDHDDNVYVVHAAKVYMIEYRNCNQKYVTVMKSSYTYDPDHSYSLSGSIRCKNRNLVFDGYYLDSKFKVKATVIFAGSNGNKIIYLKWHIAECGATRTGEKTITDADHFDQKPFDKFSFFDMTGGIAYTDLASLGIKEIIFNVSFEMKEINNGYQYMFVLAGDTRGSECYCYKDYNFWGGQIHKTFEKQEESFTLNVDNILGDDFYVLFGANGAGADNWVTRNVRLSVRSE